MRLVRNMAGPFAARLFLSVLNTGYYAVQVRFAGLGGGLDLYILAGIILLYAGTISDWGLGTLLTRNLAQARQVQGGSFGPPGATAGLDGAARRLFAETFGLRLALAGAALVPLLLIAWTPLGLWLMPQRTEAGSLTLTLLALTLVPGSFAAAASALYYAYERMTWPALVQAGSGLLNVGLGVGALLLGWGIGGLAAAALLTTLGTAAIFYRQMRRDFFAPAIAWPAHPAALLTSAFPLMINGLLVTLFFRFDQLIIGQTRAPGDVTTYENAYKFINFTQIIPPSITLALFPGLARAAVHDRGELARQYRGGLKLLLVLALPLVAGTVALAPLLISLLTPGRPEYLPGSSAALQILIFYLPLSFVNGLTQYVLIALDRQRLLTWAFAAAALFNIAANWWAVPRYGINAAALITILSEVVLAVPFLWWAARALGTNVLAPGAGGLKLAGAGLVLAGVTGGVLRGLGPGLAAGVLAAGAGGAAYMLALLLTGFFTAQERALLGRVLRR